MVPSLLVLQHTGSLTQKDMSATTDWEGEVDKKADHSMIRLW